MEDGGKNGKALKKKLEESTQSFLTVIDNEKDRNELALFLHLNEQSADPSKPWEFNTFNHMPVVACITMLNKYQNDIKNAEAKIFRKSL